MTTQQVETATVVGTISTGGNATVIVTSRDMDDSPKTFSVAVLLNDGASTVAEKIRDALAYDADVSEKFLVGGSGANVSLTSHVAIANDSTLNISIANGTCAGLTVASTSTNTTAGDGLENAYATLAELKTADILNFSDTSHDAVLEREINAASRRIDEFCGRHFYQVSEIRYFTPRNHNILDVDDIYSSTGLTVEFDTNRDAVFDLTLTSSDWNLWPYNPKNGRPWVRLETTLINGYSFYVLPKSVKITALWGWASIPDQINQACVMLAQRLHKRNATILGQAAASAVGVISMKIPKIDPDVEMLLLDFRKKLT